MLSAALHDSLSDSTDTESVDSPTPHMLSANGSTAGDVCSHSDDCRHSVLRSIHSDVCALRLVVQSEMRILKAEFAQSLDALKSELTSMMKTQFAQLHGPAKTNCSLVSSSPDSVTREQHVTTPVSSVQECDESDALLHRSVTAPSLPSESSGWNNNSGFIDSDCGDDWNTNAHPPLPEHILNAEDPAHQLELLIKENLSKKESAAAAADAVPAAKLVEVAAPPAPSAPITESGLIALATRILTDHGSVPVGKMGSLLHKAANDHTLPSLLKERYGGLKKFLQAHLQYFVLGEDHPYNPHVSLVGQQQPSQPAQAASAVSASSATATAAASIASKDISPTNAVGFALSSTLHNHNVNPIVTSLPLSQSTRSLSYLSLCDSNIDSPMVGTMGSATRKAIGPSRLLYDETSSTRPGRHNDNIVTSVIAIDCEMVGCGEFGMRSVLARCSIVNYYGHVLYDVYVQPPLNEIVMDYRTHVSGIRPSHLSPCTALEFNVVQSEVRQLLNGRILVAHSVQSDLTALALTHPPQLIRDTATSSIFCPLRARSLKALVSERLSSPQWENFQVAAHDSVEDARAVLALYQSVENQWEETIARENAVLNKQHQMSLLHSPPSSSTSSASSSQLQSHSHSYSNLQALTPSSSQQSPSYAHGTAKSTPISIRSPYQHNNNNNNNNITNIQSSSPPHTSSSSTSHSYGAMNYNMNLSNGNNIPLSPNTPMSLRYHFG